MRNFILWTFLMSGLAVMGQSQLPIAERQALIDFYEATQGDQWRNNSNWKNEDGEFSPPGTEHTWYGVVLGPEGTHVQNIQMGRNNTAGVVPESFSNLQKLKSFLMIDGHLAAFPSALLELPELERLHLENVGLTGTLPEALGRVVNLDFLNLSHNALTGPIPQALGQLTRLEIFDVSHNAFTAIPDLSAAEDLFQFSAQVNMLSGSIPAWIAMLKASIVDLSGNQFTGGVPDALAGLEQYMQLNLNDNQIDHFPSGPWNDNLDINLGNNLLTEANCEALIAASEAGTDIDFFQQKTGLLRCGDMRLQQSLPWVSNVTDEWASSIVVYNPSSQDAVIRYIHPEQTFIPELTIPSKSYRNIRPPNLATGYSLKIYSDNADISASYFVSGQLSPSGRSPAMTHGRSLEDAASHLMFPVLPGELKAAFAIHAAETVGETVLTLRLHGPQGLLETTELILADDLPKAFLIPTIFPNAPRDLDLALEVLGPPETKLLGTAFAFNDANEPAMMPGIPFNRASHDWMFPWAATNEQFVSRISVFNPGSEAVLTSIQAMTPQGDILEVARRVAAGGHVSYETGTLFPQLEKGYALSLKSVREGSTIPQKVFANIQVGRRQDRLSGSSPALTYALDPSKLTPVVSLPLPNLREIPAVVLQAPDQTEPVEVLLMGMSFGNRILGSVILEDGLPKPVLLRDFLRSGGENPHLITAMATSGEPIAGSIFYFNGYLEPSITQGLNQAWFDLSVSLNAQVDEGLLTAIVENNGPFSNPEGTDVVISANGSEVYRYALEPMQVGERQVISVPPEHFTIQPGTIALKAHLQIPLTQFDRNHENNQITLPVERTLEIAHSHRISEATERTYTGLLHADEEAFEVFFSRLFLMPGDVLDWKLERLQVGTVGSFRNTDYRFHYAWEPAEQVEVAWDVDQAVMRMAALETSAVYRLTAAIQTADGELVEASHQLGLSKSRFDQSSMTVFEEPASVRSAPRVYHPFDNRNWMDDYFAIRPSESGFSGDEDADGFPLLNILIAIRQEAEFDLGTEYILELPEGLIHLGLYTLDFTAPPTRTGGPMNFTLQGGGKHKTMITNPNLQPARSVEGEFLSNEERISFAGYETVTLKDFALWGATPGDLPVMEVSGRPNYEFNNQLRRPYGWYAVGMECTNIGNLEMGDVHLRFHSVSLRLDNSRLDPSQRIQLSRISNVSMAYCDLGLVLTHIENVHVGPQLEVHHASSQGILGNNISNLVIEDAHIDGGRHRGINLDRARHIRIRNNLIRNSGQSGIHLGGNVHYAAITGNTIQTVDRDRVNTFGDQNSVDGTIMSYRPLYEGIKTARGAWGASSHLLIADNDISDVANGIAVAQVEKSDVLIENNRIEAMQRGIRLEFGHARLLVRNGLTFQGELKNLFVMPDNQISLLEPVATDNQLRHGILFPGNDANCPGCNIGFLDSYGEDIGKEIAYYPFPIEFSYINEWFSNEDFVNSGPVYLPPTGENDYQHPNAPSLPLDQTARTLAAELRQRILDPLP